MSHSLNIIGDEREQAKVYREQREEKRRAKQATLEARRRITISLENPQPDGDVAEMEDAMNEIEEDLDVPETQNVPETQIVVPRLRTAYRYMIGGAVIAAAAAAPLPLVLSTNNQSDSLAHAPGAATKEAYDDFSRDWLPPFLKNTSTMNEWKRVQSLLAKKNPSSRNLADAGQAMTNMQRCMDSANIQLEDLPIDPIEHERALRTIIDWKMAIAIESVTPDENGQPSPYASKLKAMLDASEKVSPDKRYAFLMKEYLKHDPRLQMDEIWRLQKQSNSDKDILNSDDVRTFVKRAIKVDWDHAVEVGLDTKQGNTALRRALRGYEKYTGATMQLDDVVPEDEIQVAAASLWNTACEKAQDESSDEALSDFYLWDLITEHTNCDFPVDIEPYHAVLAKYDLSPEQ